MGQPDPCGALLCASVDPRLAGSRASASSVEVCAESGGRGSGGKLSVVREAPQAAGRQPETLCPAAGLLSTGLLTGLQAGACPRSPLLHIRARGAGAPHQRRSPGRAQGECHVGGALTPRTSWIPEPPWPAPGSRLESCSQRKLTPSAL